MSVQERAYAGGGAPEPGRVVSGRRAGGPGPALLVLSVVLVGCAGRGTPSPFGEAAEARAITLDVENQNYLDVVVFVLQDDTSIRVGDVPGLTSSTLSIPGHLVSMARIRLLVDPIGSSEAYLSGDIPVDPRDVVVLRVGSAIQMSSWSIR